MWRTEWTVFGGICAALVVFSFVKHVFYVVKNVWLVKRSLDEPQRVLPPPGVVTLNGIISSIGEETPVQVTLVEHGRSGKGRFYWRQTSYRVDAHRFALLLPELGARIVVEPGENVRLRASATATDWAYDKEAGEGRRVRTAILEDGDRVLINGLLEEKREVELIVNEYRSQKEKIRVEYLLKPIPDAGIRIDSETLLHELQMLLGPLGWVRALGTVLVVPAYVYALQEAFSTRSNILFVVILVVYSFIRTSYTDIDRRPWFDRPIDPRKPYHGAENLKPPESPWGP